MTRPSKRKIEDNPLRQLRSLIGGQKPVPQHRLASIVGISVNTIRGIEAAHRPLGKAALEKIELMTGAFWDEQNKKWLFGRMEGRQRGRRRGLSPFSFELYQEYHRMTIKVPLAMRELDRASVKRRIDALFDRVPDRSWLVLLGKIQNFLDECRGSECRRDPVRRKELEEIFYLTKSQFFFVVNPETKKIEQFGRHYPLTSQPDFKERRIGIVSGKSLPSC